MQQLTTIIEEAIQNHELKVELFPRITQDDVYRSVRSVMRENPDIFWFSHQWHYSQEEAIVRFRYTIDEKRSARIKHQIGDVIQNDFKIEEVRQLSVIEQVMYVYKWVAMYCNYDIHSAHNQTIYSVFVLRNSVCTGIAKATQYFLKLLGIECRLVFGRMHNSDETSRHCWLIVCIDGKWYHLDPTFANREIEYLLYQSVVEPVEGTDWLCYNFFCVDTETILESRSIEDELPDCNDTIDYTKYQNIEITLSRNGDKKGVGCLLSSSGTTADIYLAHSGDKHDRRHSVAKVYRDDPDHELLRKELIVTRECAGPHLLRATDADFNKGILFMEQATPLSELLSSHYFKLTLKELCRILIDITSGLQELQEHGFIYRDIHLNNIYLSGKDVLGKQIYKLGDFGSCTFYDKNGKHAGLTEKGGVGSKWYMAPETWNEGIFDERSAVYGVGMIAYFLLNDLFPPLWKEYGEDSYKRRYEGVPVGSICLDFMNNVEVSQLLDDLLQKSLSFDPHERYQSLSELHHRLAYLSAKIENKDCTLRCSSQYYDEDYNKTFIAPLHQTDVDYLEADLTCANCGSHFKINILQDLVEQMLPTLPSDDSLGGLALQLDKMTDVATCPTCGYGNSLKDSYESDRLLIPTLHKDSGTHVPEFNSTCSGNPSIEVSNGEVGAYDTSSQIDESACTCGGRLGNDGSIDYSNEPLRRKEETYYPESNVQNPKPHRPAPMPMASQKEEGQDEGLFSKWKRKLFGSKHKEKPVQQTPVIEPIKQEVQSSVFAPAEVAPNQHMMVQVYLHLPEETDKVKRLATEADKNAERRGYEPLEVKLKKGDTVEIELNINGDTLLYNERKSVTWQGSFVKRAFDYLVPSDINVCELSCSVNIFVNGAIAGEMIFLTSIVDSPRQLNTNVHAKPTKKLFISYSHKDIKIAEMIAKIHEAQDIDVFFDKHRLKAGYIYSEEISRFIQTADTFVLCWSKNAEESEYVQRERQEALALAYPQRQPREYANLRIHSYNIEPHATPPPDMVKHYHFEEL